MNCNLINEKNEKIEEIRNEDYRLAKKWDISGSSSLIYNNEVLWINHHGYQDEKKSELINEKSTYRLALYAFGFVVVGIMKLIEKKMVNFNDTLDLYISEYRHAKQITIRNLLANNSGVPDYLGEIAKNLLSNQEYRKQPFEKQFVNERVIDSKGIDFNDLVSLLNSLELDYVPGSKDCEYSDTNRMLLAEVIRRVTKKSLYQFFKEIIFDPLKMNVFEGDVNTISYGVYKDTNKVVLPDVNGLDCASFTIDDLIKLGIGLINHQIIQKKSWKIITKLDKYGCCWIYNYKNGWYGFYNNLILGYNACIKINYERSLVFIRLLNTHEMFKCVNDQWIFYTDEIMNFINEKVTYPKCPKMVPFSEKVWEATEFTVNPEQIDFVMDAKSSICLAVTSKTIHPYVLVDCGVAIGLLVLNIDKKQKDFMIDIVLIDKKFQGRGYGKVLVSWGVEKLKKCGAKELSIGVMRHNTVAQKLYASVGFVNDKVWPEGIYMKIKL